MSFHHVVVMLAQRGHEGNRLATIRQARGMSGAELARRCGIHRSLVSKLEHGRITSWPAFRRRAAEVLGVDEQLLFGDIEA
jgi:transcriptional regulator with XRE-family HTH domain